jgi:hypothetical protein
MDNAQILERLESLEALIDKTEPDIPNEKDLFSMHSIQTQENIEWMRNIVTGKTNHDPDTTRANIIQIMKDSNRMWGIRNKILNGDWDDLQELSIQEGIEEFLAEGQKINAIKYYRSEMKDKYDKEVSLREAKDHVDSIHNDMRRTGMAIR